MSEAKQKYCEWCSKKTDNEPTKISSTPILEELEQEIDSYENRDEIWGVNSDWSKLGLTSTFEAKLMVYDEMLNQIESRTICTNCLKQDEILYEKYYGDEIIISLDFDIPEDLN